MEDNKKTDAEDEALAWEEVSTKHIVQNEWIDFRESIYRFPDGKEFSPYYSYTRRNYVVIVASDEEGKLLCVRQYRQGIQEVTTEFVAGGIEAGEEALAAAKRELKEETGYETDQWKFLLKVPSHATISGDYAFVYMAENCRKSSGQDLDETEYLNVSRLTADEIEERIAAGKFQQAVHIMAWLLARRSAS